MALLSVHLLGRFEVKLDDRAAAGFSTDKARALLAYLVTESDRPHRRQALAGLLWPGYPEQSARTSLRTALANLRRVIGDRHATPPCLLISRKTIAINPDCELWVDVTAFEHLLSANPSSHPDIGRLDSDQTRADQEPDDGRLESVDDRVCDTR